MKKNEQPAERTILVGDDWTVPNENGVGRRTLVQASAWTIPVVAMATATPAAAASMQPTLEFVNGPYSVDSCATLNNVVLTATTNGSTPAANQQVTVTLPDGLTWSDGSITPRIFTTDANGNVTVDPITAVAGQGTVTLSATSGSGVTATTSVAINATGIAYHREPDGTLAAYTSVPAGSKVVGDNFYLTPDGDLYFGNTLMASNVTSAASDPAPDLGWYGSWVSNGVAYHREPDGTLASYTSVPTGSTVVGDNLYLTDGGDLYFGNTLLASNVTSAASDPAPGLGWYISWVSNGVAYHREPDGTLASYTSVPTGSTVVGDNIYLTDGGDLYFGNTLMASNVTSAASDPAPGLGWYMSWVSNGVAYHREPDGTLAAYTSVPSGAVVAGDNYYRADGNLYFGNNIIASGVTSAVSDPAPNRGWYASWVAGSCS